MPNKISINVSFSSSDLSGTGSGAFGENGPHFAAPGSYASSMLYPNSGAYNPSHYNPGRYGAAAAYSPLINHTYAAAAVAAAASSAPSPSVAGAAASIGGGAAADNDDASSYKSTRSTRSKDFSVDSASASGGVTIKEDPDGDQQQRQQAQRQSRDEKKARELGVPFSVQDIVNLPMDEFNDMLSRHELNEEQLNLCRDIRRRGKNKVAAQNCRKRKIDQIAMLEAQVDSTRRRKHELMVEREELYRQRNEWTSKLMMLEEDMLYAMKKDPKAWSVELDGREGEIRVVRRQAASAAAAVAGPSAGAVGGMGTASTSRAADQVG